MEWGRTELTRSTRQARRRAFQESQSRRCATIHPIPSITRHCGDGVIPLCMLKIISSNSHLPSGSRFRCVSFSPIRRRRIGNRTPACMTVLPGLHSLVSPSSSSDSDAIDRGNVTGPRALFVPSIPTYPPRHTSKANRDVYLFVGNNRTL